MTLAIDKTTKLGALLTSVKNYPGGVRQLAADMDMAESTLYGKLRGEKGYPMNYRDGDDLDEILDFLRSREVEGWERTIHVFAHRHDHVAIPIPRALKEGSAENLKQIGEIMREVSLIAQTIGEAVDKDKADGELINSKEFKRIEHACNEAIEKIIETRERCKRQHEEAKEKGLVK